MFIAQCGQCAGIGRKRRARQNPKRLPGHGLVVLEISAVLWRLLFRGADRVINRVDLDVFGDTNQRRLCRPLIAIGGAHQGTMMSGALPESQASLAPDDAGQFLDQMLLGRSLWLVLGDERSEQ